MKTRDENRARLGGESFLILPFGSFRARVSLMPAGIAAVVRRWWTPFRLSQFKLQSRDAAVAPRGVFSISALPEHRGDFDIRSAEFISDNLQDELASDIYYSPLRAKLQNLGAVATATATLSLLSLTESHAISAEGACRDGAFSFLFSVERAAQKLNVRNPESIWACALRGLNRLLLSQTNKNESTVNRRCLQMSGATSGGMWMEPRIAV